MLSSGFCAGFEGLQVAAVDVENGELNACGALE